MRRFLLVIVPACVVLTACGSSGDSAPSATMSPTSSVVAPSGSDPSSETPSPSDSTAVTPDGENPNPVGEPVVVETDPEPAPVMTSPPSTLPVGMTIPPGQIEFRRLTDLSSECETAVAPLRSLMDEYISGLLIESEADNERLNDGLETARDGCGDDFSRFVNEEMLGWLNAAVPEDE